MTKKSNGEARPHSGKQLLRAVGILPVVTVHNVDAAVSIGAALLEGGLDTIEITLRTKMALDAIAMLKSELPALRVGAGTVTSLDLLESAVDAGADFIVTPGTPAELARALATASIPAVPGAATATEIMALAALGFDAVKLFPAAAVGGLPLVRSLRGPLPDIGLCPTGGIVEAEAGAYLREANVVAVGGSWMVREDWVRESRFDDIAESAAKARKLVEHARAG